MSESGPEPDALRGDPRVFWVEDVLRYSDMDTNGHINNAVFTVLCESGRVAFFRERWPADPDRFFVIARLEIDFRRELTYPGRVATATWLARLGRTSFGLRQALYDGDGQLAATASSVGVTMAQSTRRPFPLSVETRETLEPQLRPDAG